MAYIFDEKYYLHSKLAQLKSVGQDGWTESSLMEDFVASGITPREHYEMFGRAEGLNPNAYFNEAEYLAAKVRQARSTGEKDADGKQYTVESLQKAIADSGMIPAEHYECCGAYCTDADGRYVNPSNAFDVNSYFAARLLQVWNDNTKIRGKVGIDVSMPDLLGSMSESSLSPVAHYLAHGAKEAAASGIPMVQTVPMAQRVRNDPKRVTTTREIVPANYNSPTPPPCKVIFPFPPPKPADMGGHVPASISPEVVQPLEPIPTPEEPGYLAPPEGWADTHSQPIVPQSMVDAENAVVHWVSVDTYNKSGLVVSSDGTVLETLPPGTVHFEGSGNCVIDSAHPAVFAFYAFAASQSVDNVNFTHEHPEVFSTSFGSEGVVEEQSVDLSQVTLEAGQTLIIESNGSKIHVDNDTSHPLTGDALAALLTEAIPDGWTVDRDGTTLKYSAETYGDKDPIKLMYTTAVAETQSINLEGIVLDDGEALYADGSIVYIHSGTTLQGADLASAIAINGGLDGWSLQDDGCKITFVSTTPSIDHESLFITYGLYQQQLVVREEIKGAVNTVELAVNEDVKGRDTVLSESSLLTLDSISGFDWSEDRIALPTPITDLIKGSQELSAVNETEFAALAGTGQGQVGANQAGLFKHNGDYYLLVNDMDASFNAEIDIIIRLVGISDDDAIAMTTDIFV